MLIPSRPFWHAITLAQWINTAICWSRYSDRAASYGEAQLMPHQVGSSNDDATRRVDPFLMSVLKSRFEAVVREMTLVVMKASRSAVIKNAKDLSFAILTYDHRLVSTEEALPIHVMSMDKATRPITELFSDIKQGDVFLNNC